MADFLNQSDIDKLLAESVADEQPNIFRADGERFQDLSRVTVSGFDFRTPIFLAESELRRLRMIHQQFIDALSARLSTFLRADYGLKMSKLTTMAYSKFAEMVHNPSHLTLFKVDPLPGIGVLEIQPRLALSMTNRMLGGRGVISEPDRYLTEIEVALLEEVIQLIIDEWRTQWREETELTSSQIGHETNARFLQICSEETVMLVLGLETASGEAVHELNIGVPYYMMEPILKKLQSKQRELEPEVQPTSRRWRPAYNQISVEVIADWQMPEVAVSDLLRLRVGDVLQMPLTLIENTRIRFGSSPRFVARAGCEEGRVAVEIRERTGCLQTTSVNQAE